MREQTVMASETGDEVDDRSVGRSILAFPAAIAAMSLLVVALWAWGRADWWTIDATRPDVARWAIRSGVVGIIAVAEFLVLNLVAGAIFRRNTATTKFFSWMIGGIGGIALVSAIALALAGQ